MGLKKVGEKITILEDPVLGTKSENATVKGYLYAKRGGSEKVVGYLVLPDVGEGSENWVGPVTLTGAVISGPCDYYRTSKKSLLKVSP